VPDEVGRPGWSLLRGAAGLAGPARSPHPSVAANPYLTFRCRSDRSSDLRFTWFDDDGGSFTATHRVEVVA
jgi:hypothetical protein